MIKGNSQGTYVFGPSNLVDNGTALLYKGAPIGGGAGGTVTGVTGAAPLFTCTGTVAVVCSLSTAAATSFFGNPTGSAAAPLFMTAAQALTTIGAAPIANPAFTGNGSITTSFSIGGAGNPASTALTITGSANGFIPGLLSIVDNTTATGTDYGFTHIAAGLPTGGVMTSVIGKAATNGNAFVINWNQTASTATNSWCIAVWGMAATCNLQGFLNGSVTGLRNVFDDGSGNASVTGNFTAQGTINSTANTLPASITNSGVSLSASPSVADVVYYDSTRTTNNHIVDALWLSGAYSLRFKSDDQATAATFFSASGGQAGGITGITSSSGTGAWVHTGTFSATTNLNFNGGLTKNNVGVHPVNSCIVTTASAATTATCPITGGAAGNVCTYSPSNAAAALLVRGVASTTAPFAGNVPLLTMAAATATLTFQTGGGATGIQAVAGSETFNVTCPI